MLSFEFGIFFVGSFEGKSRPELLMMTTMMSMLIKYCKGKVTPKQAYVALRGPGGKAPDF
jgi:hypothetical protein